MAGSLLDRALGIIELLAAEAHGLKLQDLADRLTIPKSAAHRLLADLIRHGYVRQNSVGTYLLTTKVLSLGYSWLGGSGVADMVQPTLDRLALSTGELVRYAVVDGERLAWIAKAQGARFGLRVDPDQGMEPILYCTATGHAWLATLREEDAIRLVLAQGLGHLAEQGPNAPRSIDALQHQLMQVRERGYALVIDSSAVGTASMAAPVRHPITQRVVGILSIAGPSARLVQERMRQIAPDLLAAATELGIASAESPLPPITDQKPDVGRGSLVLGSGQRRSGGLLPTGT